MKDENMRKNRYVLAIITTFLMIAIAMPLLNLPIADGQVTRTTYAYIGATPNPIGIGQETLLHLGITHPTAWPHAGWVGLTVTVTKPDGTTQTLGPFTTDPTGGTGTVLVPNMIGNYTLRTNFPEQKITTAAYGTPVNSTMLASTSDPLTLIVQADPTPIFIDYPLPTEYWTRPINAQFWTWNTIANNWVAYARGTDGSPTSSIAPYTTGPETGHILWSKQLVLGGLAGGVEVGPQSYDHGDAYEGRWGHSGALGGPVIIHGILFYNEHQQDGSATIEQTVKAVDLKSGEVLWNRFLNDSTGRSHRLAFGQVYYFDNFNQHSVYAYLWAVQGSNWHAFDPLTGRWVYSMSNVPSGTNIYAPNGEIHRYNVNLAQNTITWWNSSRVVEYHRRSLSSNYDTDSSRGSWIRTYNGFVLNGSLGIEWTKPIGGQPIGTRILPGSMYKLREGVILGANFQRGTVAPEPAAMWAISTAPGREGQILFNTTFTFPKDSHISIEDASVEDNAFNVACQETTQQWVFSLSTGQKIWGPSQPQNYLDQYGYASGNRWDVIYDGKLFAGSWGGTLYTYDINTGDLLWTYNAEDVNNQILWGNNWPIRIAFIADGKVYLEHHEHSPVDPLPKGAPFVAIDIETGEKVFEINLRGTEWGTTPIIADGVIAMFNSYDGRIYSLGKGPTSTTITAPNVAVETGKSIVVRGSVTDVSAGTKQSEVAARFPNGVAAVSDASMSAWMEYVYMQKPRPMDITGIEVTIDVVDSNGNYRNIGTATSDSTGTYSFTWQPDIEGTYNVIATFAGSKSYWPSFAQTTFVADAAPPTPAPTNVPAESVADMYFVPAIAGLFVLIIIVLILVVLLMLKKRP
jgi:outer membrane protein assembly factor BamB